MIIALVFLLKYSGPSGTIDAIQDYLPQACHLANFRHDPSAIAMPTTLALTLE
jgi:hypothetical protein